MRREVRRASSAERADVRRGNLSSDLMGQLSRCRPRVWQIQRLKSNDQRVLYTVTQQQLLHAILSFVKYCQVRVLV